MHYAIYIVHHMISAVDHMISAVYHMIIVVHHMISAVDHMIIVVYHMISVMLLRYVCCLQLVILTTVLTELPALMRERATRVWPFLAAKWRGENCGRDNWRISGQWEMRRWTVSRWPY